jgi:hypothetical protein
MFGTAVKKTALALAATMLFMAVTCPTVRFATANPIPYPDTPSTELPTLIIRTPKNYSDYYADNTFKLDFIIIQPESWDSLYRGFIPIIGSYGTLVYLDGNATWNLERSPRSATVTDFAAIFSNLTDTEHVLNIVVIAEAYYEAQYTRGNEIITTGNSNNTYITQAVNFQINPNTKTVSFQKSPLATSRDPYPSPPIIIPIIISPQSTNYAIANTTQFTLPLDFSIDGTTSWIGYSVDNQTRVTIHGNSTLSNLEVGSHNITLFASDIFGNMGISNTTYFSIGEQVAAPTTRPFPASLFFVSSVGIVAVVSGLLVYLKKHQRNKST